jgi:predicted enzyme related to lactoylglutathione lyase
MAKVVGIGGVFFKSNDPAKLGEWYQKWLGMPVEPPYGASLKPETMPEGGLTVWAPFPADTKYFDPSGRDYMFNLVVDDLDGALEQVREGGAEIVGDIEDYDYGRFGHFLDPDGNKVELWEPKPGGFDTAEPAE